MREAREEIPDSLWYKDARIIFTDFESCNWTWDPVAQAYYWHRFCKHQPDLNYDNPRVRREILRVLDFWFQMGVDGMRLDAVPYLVECEDTNRENLPETHAVVKELRAHLDRKFSDRLLPAEANHWPEDAAAYFGNGDESHMAFHFPIMPRLVGRRGRPFWPDCAGSASAKSAPGRSGSTVIITGARSCTPARTSPSSIPRASRPGRSRNAASDNRPCGTRPG